MLYGRWWSLAVVLCLAQHSVNSANETSPLVPPERRRRQSKSQLANFDLFDGGGMALSGRPQAAHMFFFALTFTDPSEVVVITADSAKSKSAFPVSSLVDGLVRNSH